MKLNKGHRYVRQLPIITHMNQNSYATEYMGFRKYFNNDTPLYVLTSSSYVNLTDSNRAYIWKLYKQYKRRMNND